MEYLIFGFSINNIFNYFYCTVQINKLKNNLEFIDNTIDIDNNSLNNLNMIKNGNWVNVCLNTKLKVNKNIEKIKLPGHDDCILLTDSIPYNKNYFNFFFENKDKDSIIYNYNKINNKVDYIYFEDSNKNEININFCDTYFKQFINIDNKIEKFDINNTNNITIFNHFKLTLLSMILKKENLKLQTGYLNENTNYNLIGYTNGKLFNLLYLSQSSKNIFSEYINKRIIKYNNYKKINIISVGFLLFISKYYK